MLSASAISPFDPESENWWSKGTSRLAKRVCDAGLFIHNLRVKMRFGDLTRAPLEMLRLQLKGSVAECDWMARSPDPWDADLRPDIGQRHASMQAIKDAVDVRNLLFQKLPDVDAAYLRIYRASPILSRTYHCRPCSSCRTLFSQRSLRRHARQTSRVPFLPGK